MLGKCHDKAHPKDETAIRVNDPIVAWALIEIAASSHPQATKNSLTLNCDSVAAIRPSAGLRSDKAGPRSWYGRVKTAYKTSSSRASTDFDPLQFCR